MTHRAAKTAMALGLLAAALLSAEEAAAFRCGNKIVRDGMHEQQVIAACGEPTAMRHLGYALRAYDLSTRYGWVRGNLEYYPGYGVINQEVLITEYIYNFGPRRLMRRLVFEGGFLVDVETLGYGYVEKDE